jgi:Transposase DDE domain
VAGVWFPIAAVLTPANVADSDPAPALLREVPAEVRFVLGDRHYNTPELSANCEQANRLLVTTRSGRYPHTDDGVEVRRIFHKLRSIAMENFNELIFGIFDGHGQVPDLWLARHPTLRERRSSVSINLLYCTALSTTWNFALDSKPFSNRPDDV